MTARHVAGFTLLEALVTLVIVSLIVTALMQALSQALAMRETVIRYQRETREAGLQEMWFRDSVAGGVADHPEAYGATQGDAKGFELLTLAPLAGDGMVRASWRLKRVEGGEGLFYSDARLGEVLVLPGPLKDGAFQYLDGSGKWHARWETGTADGEAIPRAIRFEAHSVLRNVSWVAALLARPRPPEILRPEDAIGNAF